MLTKKRIIIAVITVLAVAASIILFTRSCSRKNEQTAEEAAIEKEVKLLYGIDMDEYDITDYTVERGQTISHILTPLGISPAAIDRLVRIAQPVFPLRNIRAGHPYTVFTSKDSTQKLQYLVYEENIVDYIVFDFRSDTARVTRQQKDVSQQRRKTTATINSSLWNCMVENGVSPVLAMDLSDIYAWSIDFFGLQQGDKFTVIYDQKYIDTTSVGIGTIWGAEFEHGGKTYYAIPFIQNGKVSYWDEDGNSLRKNMLKAPLKYSRISSKFTNARFHPILKIWRAHHGVDYAAPAGTPVIAVGDGVVTYKGYSGGGGNTIKIKHSQGLSTCYMHLKGYAKGIAKGKHVRQGDLIGYVGSTGLSTGPHLDYRVYRNGTPINPLTIPTQPAEPIKESSREMFNHVRDRILAELKGDVPDSMKIVSLQDIPSAE